MMTAPTVAALLLRIALTAKAAKKLARKGSTPPFEQSKTLPISEKYTLPARGVSVSSKR